MKNQTEMWWPSFLLSTVLISIFLALTATTARTGNFRVVFVYMLLTWISYMAAHKTATGRFVDGKEPSEQKETGKDESMTPKDMIENSGFMAGGIIFITGIIIGAYGIHLLRIPITFVGSLLFNLGYIISHYSTTGELL